MQTYRVLTTASAAPTPVAANTGDYTNTAKLKPISIGLHHPLDGIANPKYKLLHFLKTNFFPKQRRH